MQEDVFTALAHPCRQQVITCLANSKSITIDELAAYCDEDAGSNPRISMYHNHLPHLDEVEAITWDSESGTISRGPQFEKFSRVLQADAIPA